MNLKEIFKNQRDKTYSLIIELHDILDSYYGSSEATELIRNYLFELTEAKSSLLYYYTLEKYKKED